MLEKKNLFHMSNQGALRQMLKGGSGKHLFKQGEHHDKEFWNFSCPFRKQKTVRNKGT